MTSLRSLIVEDSPEQAEALVQALRCGGYEVVQHRVDTAETMATALDASSWDVLLCNPVLSRFDAFAALALLRAREMDLPFILVSGTVTLETALALFKAGAHDYVPQGQPARLADVVARELREVAVRQEQRRAQDDLRQSHARYRDLVETIQDWTWEVDAQAIYTYVSPRVFAILGYQPSELVGRSVFGIMPPQEAQRVQAIFDEVMARWAPLVTVENKVMHKTGRLVIMETSGKPFFDPQGRLLGYRGVDRDITQHKQAEDALRAQKQLEANFLRAQRLESLGTLASGMAHDLNNVLAPILMSVQFLRETVPDEASRTMLATLEASARRGAKIIQQLLTFGGGITSERMLLQPKHLLQEMAHIVQETFPKSILVTVDYSDDLRAVTGDPTQLHQVILNLCINARDAMPEGGQLTLKAENVPLDEAYIQMNPEAKVGPYVLLTVADTGVGIAPAIYDKIFDPFFTTKTPDKGTGLGLATALGIVKKHGGFMQVQSEPGLGAQFRVYLPASSTDALESPAVENPITPRGHDELILIVEDEASVRQITQQTLEKNGYCVLAANDGAEAVALYAQHAPAIRLVLTDMMMPVMDGASTIRALRKINPCLPIIAASGIMSAKPELEYAGATVEAFLTKPFTAEQLLATLQRVLKMVNL